MKVLILSDINSAHTEKWVRGLCSQGVNICLFSFTTPIGNWHLQLDNFTLGFSPSKTGSSSKLKTKLGYFQYLPDLKKSIQSFEPDVLHAHYASSYGLIGKLSKFKPFVVSVWGSDIYEFPKRSWLNKLVLKKVLKSASVICSTSNCMGKETQKYTKKAVKTIPFGIKISDFKCQRDDLNNKDEIVIGCIKNIAPNYGTDKLIQAFSEVLLVKQNVRLLLVGGGEFITTCKQLVEKLNIQDKVDFTGSVPLKEVPSYHCQIDIYVTMSRAESFGVSLIEAMASGSHIVATKAEGFLEVLRSSNENALMIDVDSVSQAKESILSILNDPASAKERSKRALKVVEDNYSWEHNLIEMREVYGDLLDKKETV